MVTNAARLSLAITVTLGTLAVATACGGDDAGGGGGQTGGTGGGLVTGGTGGGGGTPVTGGTGGADAGNGDGNDTMETASSLTLGTKTSAKLDPPGSDVDWYEFEGKAGQVVAISGVAKVFEGFDPAYPDLAITLYDANGTQIAEQDDPWPWYTTDPYLLTVLPSDGLYFLRVLECHAFNPGAQGCSDLNAIIITDYSLLVKELTFSDATEVKETEPNGDAATASSMTFKPDPNQPGQFYTTLLFGGFENESDVDVYGITTPTGVALHAGARPALVLAPQSAGIDGNGSSTSAGEIYVTTKADPADVLAKIDVPLGGRLFIPVTQGTEYLLFQKRVAAPTGSMDF
jgi:hypothetical protein